MHVGMRLVRERDFPDTLTQGEFARDLKPLPTSPQLRVVRLQTL